jgi:hypothetical protein
LKGISKKARTLIFSSAGLLLLIAAVIVLSLTDEKPPEKDNEDLPEAMPGRIHFAEYEPDDLLSMHVLNEHGVYTVARTMDGELGVMELHGAPLNFMQLRNSARYMAGFWVRDTVEEDAKNLEQYGLGDTAAWALAVFADGETLEVFIGNRTPTVEDMTYVRIGDDNTVYVTWSYLVSHIKESSLFYVSLELTPGYDELGFPDIERLVIDRPGHERYIIGINPRALDPDVIISKYIFTEPVQVEVDATRGGSLMEGMFGLTAAKAVLVDENLIQELPEEYADIFDDLFAAVEITIDSLTRILIIGGRHYEADDEGEMIFAGHYGIYSNYPEVLYVFAPEELSWLNFTIDSVMATMFMRPLIYSLDGLIVETPEQRLNFRITGTGRSDEEFFLDGAVIDTDAFKQLYMYVIQVSAETLFTGEPEDVANLPFAARYTFKHREEGRPDDILEFYELGNMRSLIVVNGEPMFTTRTAYLTRLEQNIEAYLKGEALIQSW